MYKNITCSNRSNTAVIREVFRVHHHDGVRGSFLHHVAHNLPVVRARIVLQDGVIGLPALVVVMVVPS